MQENERNERYNRLYSEQFPDNSLDDYREETAAEIAAPITYNRDSDYYRVDHDRETRTGGKGIGITALILSIMSLFTMPLLFGATGIVLGFIAQRRGATTLGAWSISLGALSIIIGIFLRPFF